MFKEAITVTTRSGQYDKVIPLSFTYRGNIFQVEATGRRWSDEEGDHVLVMVPGGRVYHLLFNAESNTWFLVPRPSTPTRLPG
jgi:hypothetical protein